MALKNQFQTLKENWLLLALVVVVLVVFSGLNPTQTFTNKIAMDESVDLTASRSSSFVPYYDNFAPEAAQRFITKTSSLSTEIKTSYLSSSYTMKVETSKYDSLVSQLKTIGEITYFNENSDDITEQKLDLQTSLEAERERLARYKQLLETAQTTQEKIELTDKIFEEERTIKYYEEALENVNNQVSYSTVYLTITEKRSDFANAAFIKFSQIVTSFVDSINSLINLIFVLIPWAIALLIIWLIYRKFKN